MAQKKIRIILEARDESVDMVAKLGIETIDVRKVWDLVRHHDDIDDGRAVRSEGFADRGLELTRLAGRKPVKSREFDEIIDIAPRVIIAGYGRVGQIVARLLRAQHISFTALESSVEQVDFSRQFGSSIYFGDPSRPELLRAAGAHHQLP